MTSPSADPPTPGTVLADRYEILRPLGSGGMGVVYLARHRLMERLCAIKVLHPALARDQEAFDRFTGEARNASRIHHPNVCTVYDFGTTSEGLVYLAMEYIDGRTLGTVLAEQGALPLHRAAALLDGIAAGLDAAHALGIVHRDLKPDNVMVVAGAERETVKLVDFGIAKALERDLARDVTAPGTVVGTPDYMAPEQFAGDPVDRRTDGYSLGLIFYRMVTGALPHRADTARQTLARRLTDPAEPLAQAAPGIAWPDGLQAVMDRALARRPEARFGGAADFATAVRGALAGLPDASDSTPTVRLDAATARMEGAAQATRPVRRGGRWLVPAGLVAAAAITAALVLKPGPTGVDPLAQGVDTISLGVADRTEDSPPAGGSPAEPETAPSTIPLSRDVPPPPPPPPPSSSAETREPRDDPPSIATRPIPALPSVDAIFNPETQAAAQRDLEEIFRASDVDTLRALAAFRLSGLFSARNSLADAEIWANRAFILIDVAGTDAIRRQRYLDNLRNIQNRRKDTPPP